MKKHARKLIDERILDETSVYKLLCDLFPKVNDFYKSETGYTEELNELNVFGILTVKDLRLLLKRHRKMILEIDKSPIDSYHQEIYKEEMGAAVFNNFMRKRFWFAYPGLLRLALELEFGAKYEEFANARDGI
jgi:hypothetical protein